MKNKARMVLIAIILTIAVYSCKTVRYTEDYDWRQDVTITSFY